MAGLGSNHPFGIRTVLDTRSRSSKYLFQVLLLVASWHKRVRQTAPLEVLIIGEPPEALRRFLNDCDVRTMSVDPDPNDSNSKTSNAILGACNTNGQRILLVDNDVVFWGDLRALQGMDSQRTMGSVAGLMRVKEGQWSVIGEHFRYLPPPTDRYSLRELINGTIEPDYQPRPLERLYVNGGVLLLPASNDFGPLWRRCVGEIADLFAEHPLRSGSVYGSNMAGLAMAISEYGRFDWLDTRFNYRPDCFALGLEPPERIEIVHLTGVSDSHLSITRRIEDYWQEKMLCRFNRVSGVLKSDERDRRLGVLEAFRCELDSLVHEYDLVKWGQQLPVDVSYLWKSMWHRKIGRPLYQTYRTALRPAVWLRRRLTASILGAS